MLHASKPTRASTVTANFKLNNVIYTFFSCKYHSYGNRHTRSLIKPNMTQVILWAWSREHAGVLCSPACHRPACHLQEAVVLEAFWKVMRSLWLIYSIFFLVGAKHWNNLTIIINWQKTDEFAGVKSGGLPIDGQDHRSG